jgi:hypothetical protein
MKGRMLMAKKARKTAKKLGNVKKLTSKAMLKVQPLLRIAPCSNE